MSKIWGETLEGVEAQIVEIIRAGPFSGRTVQCSTTHHERFPWCLLFLSLGPNPSHFLRKNYTENFNLCEFFCLFSVM